MATTVWGTKAINGTITIESGVNDNLTIVENENTRNIFIPSGKYTTNYFKKKSLLIDEINKQFVINGVPIEALQGGIFGKDDDVLRKNVVVFKHKENGNISNFGGNMFNVIFES